MKKPIFDNIIMVDTCFSVSTDYLMKTCVELWTRKDVVDFLNDKKLEAMIPLCEDMNGSQLLKMYKMCEHDMDGMYKSLKSDLEIIHGHQNTLLLKVYIRFVDELKPYIPLSSGTTSKSVVFAIERLFSKFGRAIDVQREWSNYFDTTPPHLTTISSINRKFDEDGTLESLPRSGRPSSVLFEEKLDEIEEMVTSNPQLSIRQGAAQAGISKSSYQVAIKQLNFKPYRPTLIVELNEDDFDRRSEFCESWIEKFQNEPDLIDNIFWSDEAKFNMNTVVNRHNCTYWARENPYLKFEVPNTQQGVMVWCGISSSGVVGPYFFNDIVTGPLYKEMLVSYAWPQLKNKNFYFQHDGAGPHYAVIVREWLDRKFPDRWLGRRGPFDWPARSPDLSPCDFFLWNYLKDIVFKTPPATITELQDRIKTACEEIPEDVCRKACRSVLGRFRDCLNNEGQFLSY
ncbi:unnamed protein product [Didymodactylos carnosus]|uniref:Transposase n=1 Tax=Didymodactylos carnosus TaxID=1234261 RepID=A0A8S2KK29_9BILA|nr:unnamed protein product [Didymodactylos carnosus]CAF3857558.1 unnamed protein product [Didymodactylos carnosus]